MKYFLPYLCLIVFIPFTTYAKLTGEIIFIPANSINQLWITHINNTENARVFFGEDTVLDDIWELSVQKNGPLIVVIGDERGNFPFQQEAYLIDTTEVPAKARKLTHHRFHNVFDIAISPNGDIVFVNSLVDEGDGDPLPKDGIYFIPHRELKKASPKITLLNEVISGDVVWSPDNEHIAYTNAEGVFVFNVKTEKTIQISKVGGTPAFSPDGKKLAFSNRGWGFAHREASEIRIISLADLRPLRAIKGLEKHLVFINLKWSPNGKYIVYQASDPGIFYIAVPLNGGTPEEILNEPSLSTVYSFDWAPSAYAVDPENRLTTLWGELKTENTK